MMRHLNKYGIMYSVEEETNFQRNTFSAGNHLFTLDLHAENAVNVNV